MDLFGSFSSVVAPSLVQAAAPAAAPVMLLVTRERGEHANLFHASTDWVNAFIALHAAGVIDGARVDDWRAMRRGIENVQVCIELDRDCMA
jgi:hypothetical protein